MVTLESNMRLFRRLDRLYWLIWLLYPVTLWLSVHSILDTAALRDIMKPNPAGCFESLPLPANFSLSGKMVYWSLFASAHAFFVAMLVVVHTAIRRFAKGDVFVLKTLHSVRQLGMLIVGWAVYQLAFNNLMAYGLFVTGDLQGYHADYEVDVPTLAVGLFVLTFKFILERAVTLQEDVDLTI
ncbi:DUF2975 domain-containing protein [Telmatospirillum sp.]|uniref:DUF2975 domain-containing protein n=1 Tax=Telmatospirillum sp. TaxID=2079197 RepID=UPI0028420B79|nr:DUF2975 domain-containing protein [Telmatospirillum sp.]MDR3435052.1 DUF2975 domain-containing protein [Telmatospirillum sp.]